MNSLEAARYVTSSKRLSARHQLGLSLLAVGEHRWPSVIQISDEMLLMVDQALDAKASDEPLYAACARVMDEWRGKTARDDVLAFAMIRDWAMYEEETPYLSEIPYEVRKQMNPPWLGFYYLVRTRIEAIRAP